MKFTATPEAKSSVKLEVSASPEEVAAAIDAAVRHVAKHTKIPGFRPGKAPRAMVERVAGRARLFEEATEILVEQGYREAVIGNGGGGSGGGGCGASRFGRSHGLCKNTRRVWPANRRVSRCWFYVSRHGHAN
mgnify:CR=1 FL=1